MVLQMDPVGDFQTARRRKLENIALQQKLEQQPQRNRLLDIELKTAEAELAAQPERARIATQKAAREQQASDIDLVSQQAVFLNQTARALKELPETQWGAALERLAPSFQALGIPPEQLGSVTPQILDEVIASTQGFVGAPGGVDKFGRVFQAEGPTGRAFFQASEAGQLRELPGIRPIEGVQERKFEAAQEEKIVKEEQARKTSQREAALVGFDINTALDQAESAFTTGFAGSIAAAVPGTPAFDLRSTLDTIKANVGFNKLQEMRDNSPTGGALGQVSEQENRLLQSVLGNVEQSQSKEQFTRNLTRLKSIFDAVVNGTQPIPFTQEDFDQIPSGATYISPDTGTLHRKQ